MDIETLIDEAYAQANSERLAEESFREGLEVLLSGLKQAADKISVTGAAKIKQDIQGCLKARLQVEDYAIKNPHIHDTPIEKPVFVLGMPRTGTSLLSNFLASDPGRRSLLLWQTIDPTPPAAPENLRTDLRLLAMQKKQDLALKDKLKAVHYEPLDGMTECAPIHSQDFKSLYWELHAPMPNYSKFMLEADMSSTYAYQKRFLQVQQNGTKAKWNLKFPSHSVHIEALLKTFPDARIICTHRDPYRATGSLCSLISLAHSIYLKEPDIDFIASNYPTQLAAHLDRPLEVKSRLGDDRIYDLHYSKLMEDPVAEMSRLYEYLGDDFTGAAESGLKGWLKANPQNKHGKHAYTLEQFDLSKKILEPFYANYLSKIDVDVEDYAD